MSAVPANGTRPVRAKAIYTTGDVARLTGVAVRTAAMWFDTGLLDGYRIPGSKDRRVSAEQLMRFLAENDMPMLTFLARRPVGTGRLLAYTADARLALAALPAGWDLAPAVDPFAAGVALAGLPLGGCLADCALGRPGCLALAALVRARHPDCRLVVLANEDERQPDELAAAFDALLTRPCDPALIVTALMKGRT